MKLSEEEKEILSRIRIIAAESNTVKWSEFASVLPCKKGLHVSLTDTASEDRCLSWKEFEDAIIAEGPEQSRKSINLLSKSVTRMLLTIGDLKSNTADKTN